MANVSRPLIALLVGTVAFFALWLVAFKPSPPTKKSSGALGQYQPAIDKAHQAVGAANAASAAHGGSIPGVTPTNATATAAPAVPKTTTTTATTARTASAAAVKQRSATATVKSTTPTQRKNAVNQALGQHKTIALLFYNPAGADDRAVDQEMNRVPGDKRLVKLAVPLNELANYSVVTNQVPVDTSPTLVLIDARYQATTIVGFADVFEISHRVADALAVH